MYINVSINHAKVFVIMILVRHIRSVYIIITRYINLLKLVISYLANSIISTKTN